MQAYKKFVDAINVGALWIAIAATSLMTIMIVLQVIFRYIIQSSLSFSEELARYLFIWASFIGTAIALSKRAHISIELLVANLPKKPKRFFILLTNLISFVFYAILVVYGFAMMARTMDQTSPAMGLSMGLVYLSVPVAGIVMLANLIYNCWEEYGNPDIIKSEGAE